MAVMNYLLNKDDEEGVLEIKEETSLSAELDDDGNPMGAAEEDLDEEEGEEEDVA